jgi:hypothetical protein
MKVGMMGWYRPGDVPKEIDDRDLTLHRIEEPPIIGRAWIGAHEGVLDRVVAGIDLPMRFPLVVEPDSPTSRNRIESSPAICLRLKVPRWGFTSGMRWPANSNPAARSA